MDRADMGMEIRDHIRAIELPEIDAERPSRGDETRGFETAVHAAHDAAALVSGITDGGRMRQAADRCLVDRREHRQSCCKTHHVTAPHLSGRSGFPEFPLSLPPSVR